MGRGRTSGRNFNDRLAGALGLLIAASAAFFILAMPAGHFGLLIEALGLPGAWAFPAWGAGGLVRLVAAFGLASPLGLLVYRLFRDHGPTPRSTMDTPREPIRAAEELGNISLASHSGNEAAVIEALEAVARRFSDLSNISPSAPEAVLPMAAANDGVDGSDRGLYFDIAAIRAAATRDELLDLGQWPVISEAMADEVIAMPEASQPVSPDPDSSPVVDPIPLHPRGEDDAGVAISPAIPRDWEAESLSGSDADSIGALMRRLEDGLARRSESEEGVEASPARPLEPMGAHLRSTLDELRRMASRG